MMYVQVAAGIVIAAVASTGAWQVQEWRYGAKETQRVQQLLTTERNNAAAQIRRVDNVVIATNQARVREVALRADADRSRAALGGLRDAASNALSSARSSHDACLVRAATAAKLLQQCAGAYQELGERADRHVSDIKTLIDATTEHSEQTSRQPSRK